MLDKKKDRGNPAPLKNHVNFSEHIRSFVSVFSDQQTAKKQIVQAYQNKRDRPASIVELPVYNFSKYTLIGLHFISFLFASSFVFYLQSLSLSYGIIVILSLITILILAFSEYGQHSTLNTFFNIRFISGLVSQRLLILAIVFSLISVSSSSFGISYFFKSRAIESNGLWYMLVFVSVIVEFFIVANTYDIHRFESRAKDEVVMLNDVCYQNGASTIFVDTPPEKMPRTIISSPLSDSQKQPMVIVQEQEEQNSPYKRNRRKVTPNSNTAVTTPKKVKKAHESTGNSTSTKSHNTHKTPVITKDSVEIATKKETTSRGDKKDWSYGDVTRNIRIYQGRVEKHKEGGTPSQKINLAFFINVRDTHDFERNKTYPYTSPTQRKEWYNKQFSNTKI